MSLVIDESMQSYGDWFTRSRAKLRQELEALKPSELIRLALDDLAKTESTHKIDGLNGKIEMGDWLNVRPADSPVCTACLAGVCIGNRLELDQGLQLYQKFSPGLILMLDPWSWGDPVIQGRMLALDSFRQGAIKSGLWEMGIDVPAKLYDILPDGWLPNMVRYANDPVVWRQRMERVIRVLQSLDL